ncbi:MAG: biotin synthase BioB [Bdellovibrionota bacterium]
MLRHDWTRDEIERIYTQPFPELMYAAQTVHRENFPGNRVQRSTLLSVKTGGCPEDCAYCPQSAHHDTGVERHKVLPESVVLAKAEEAKRQGSSRFCMGAAWREVRDGSDFDQVLNLVRKVSDLGLEVCCTLGMLNADQAQRLRDAGCYAYNHNLDTSPEYYETIISTRTYQDRLDTIRNVRAAGITVCCGGIVGMGESLTDRFGLLEQLANQDPHPESVPINMLVAVEGTPLAESKKVDPLDFVRLVATARILMPKSFVRLSAGRMQMTDETQALAFLAGANSIFAGEKLLTTPNPKDDQDRMLMKRLGLEYLESAHV